MSQPADPKEGQMLSVTIPSEQPALLLEKSIEFHGIEKVVG